MGVRVCALVVWAWCAGGKRAETKSALPAVVHDNWAPGYRSGGGGEVLAGGGTDTWEAYDATYEVPEGWEIQGFKYTNPDAYVDEYAVERATCEWSPPVSVFEHTKRYLRGAYGSTFSGPRWKSKNMCWSASATPQDSRAK